MSKLAEISPLWFFVGWCVLVAILVVWFHAKGVQDQRVVADEEDWDWPPRIDDQRRD